MQFNIAVNLDASVRQSELASTSDTVVHNNITMHSALTSEPQVRPQLVRRKRQAQPLAR